MTKKPGQYLIYCKTDERKEFLQEKIHLALGLTNSKDIYSTLITALDLVNESMIRHKAGQIK